jgi:hypothetical protein
VKKKDMLPKTLEDYEYPNGKVWKELNDKEKSNRSFEVNK